MATNTKARIRVLPSFRHWSECPDLDDGLQREFEVCLLADPNAGYFTGFRFMLRECAIRQGIERGEVEDPDHILDLEAELAKAQAQAQRIMPKGV